jgi:pyruvate kinase
LRTKIVVTVGPATAEEDRIHALAELGVDVVRINFAHGTHETHARVVSWVREAAKAVARPLAILADLAGPKIRIGDLDEPVNLTDGKIVVIAPETIAVADEIPTTYASLADDVAAGNRILLDDGIMELRVVEVQQPRVRCRVVRGGLLRRNKGMNLPGIHVSAPALTEKDIADLEFALAQDIDYIGLSFVQKPEDVQDLRARVGNRALIVAKIEKDTALENLEAILTITDAVMVARGDLGVELPFEQVPLAQKRIIQLANLYGRPVITATQMLESMMENPRPTRAEASDVANALFDGTDAVMLSGETAAGKYPLLAVEAMVRIAGDAAPAARRRDADGACGRGGDDGSRTSARCACGRHLHHDRWHDSPAIQLPSARSYHRRNRPVPDVAAACARVGRRASAVQRRQQLREHAHGRARAPVARAHRATGAARRRHRRCPLPRRRHHEHVAHRGDLRLRFLGTGTSFGIPVIGCACDVCTSSDPRDRRTRHGALLESDDGARRVLIDTPPELRQQLLHAGVTSIDAVWFTHDHADHTHGIDDLRVFSARLKQRVPAFADPVTARSLRTRFAYIFDESYAPPDGTTKPDIGLCEYDPDHLVEVAGFTLVPLEVPHGDMSAYGFRVGGLGYITDAKLVPHVARAALRGVRVLVLNALWYGPSHPTHLNVEEAVDVARDIGAEITYLTHLTHRLRHAALAQSLPAGIQPAYDGLTIHFAD